LTDICPEKIIKASPPSEVISLLPSSNTANLKRIVFDVRDPVLMRLLVCKEEKSKNGTDSCPYLEHENNGAVKKACGDPERKLANVYLRHEELNKTARSCVIAFIEGKYLSKTNELMDILKTTVDWLNIAKENPYFYIIRYGQPAINLTITQTRETLTKKMKEIYKGYSDDEDTCIVLSCLPDSESLMIDHLKDHNKKFLVKVD